MIGFLLGVALVAIGLLTWAVIVLEKARVRLEVEMRAVRDKANHALACLGVKS